MARILIVEDSAAMRTYVRTVLEEAPDLGGDVEIVEATSGFDALRLLPRAAYDLVITDINMPDINGLELIRFVRQSAHHRSIAVLIISSQSAERDKKRGLALGADAFLAKPFTPEALREAVATSLAGRGAPEGGKTSQHPAEAPPDPAPEGGLG
jgi:two-component system, chemotaxis family, chemotaxis protein CheY